MFSPEPFEVVALLPGNKACARRGEDIDIVALADVAEVNRGDYILVNDGTALTKMSREDAESMTASLPTAKSGAALAS